MAANAVTEAPCGMTVSLRANAQPGAADHLVPLGHERHGADGQQLPRATLPFHNGVECHFLSIVPSRFTQPSCYLSFSAEITVSPTAIGNKFFGAWDAFMESNVLPIEQMKKDLASETELVLNEYIPFVNDWCDCTGREESLESVNGKCQSFSGQRPRKLQTHRRRGCTGHEEIHP
jgi:hypothetical protein